MDSEELLVKSIKANVVKRKVKFGEYTINYITSGEGKPLVLIHGANIGWGQWYKNIAELSKHFKIYAIDLPGSGNSTIIDFHKTEIDVVFFEIVKKFIEFNNLHEIYFIGHSIGGWIGLKLALKYKFIKKIILVNPVGISNSKPLHFRLLGIYNIALLLSKTIMSKTKVNMSSFLRSAVSNPFSIEEKFVDYYFESVIRSEVTHPFFLINKISNFFRLRKEFRLDKDLFKLDIPTLFIIGDRDKLNPVRIYANLIRNMKNTKLLILKDTGHVPLLEKPQEFNRSIIQFLQ